jgi:uncharacterized SAM-binding protein YcdF (DUF218 family)
VIRRILAAVILVWALGFAVFAFSLPGPSGPRTTDGIVVLTGGEGRIERGIMLLENDRAERMLVSGVNRTVRPVELAEQTGASEELFECCIDLDQNSVDTRSNGEEAARWIARNDFHSVRVVTTDWHMPRAKFEIARLVTHDIELLPDGVESEPDFTQLFLEYNKYVLRRLGVLIGV